MARLRARDERIGQLALCFAEGDEKQCNQCWRVLPIGRFVGKSGRITQDCDDCRGRYMKGVENHREGLRKRAKEHVVRLAVASGNRKTGPIPVSMTSSETCPPSCPFFNAGCYGESSLLRHHWRGTPKAGVRWEEFCQRVQAMPKGIIWRHNEVGDLPGNGEAVNHEALTMLALANVGKRGFTYTHKKRPRYRELLRWAAETGFTINMSADNMAEADTFFELGLPTVVVVSHTCQVNTLRTPHGHRVVICPAVRRTDLTCEKCKLCAVGTRKTIVGFPAHGIRRNLVSRLVRAK
jgi:hypothetical protein